MKQHKPHILITNDDGITAPGIKHLWNALKDFATLSVVAPLNEKSGSGVSMTLTRPLEISPVTWGNTAKVWSVNGTPADCTKLYLSVISKEKKPDIILSGINKGSNAGRNVLFSGTIGSMIEATYKNIPGIAFSSLNYFDPQYKFCEKYIPTIVKHFLTHPMPTGSIINVNFPENIANGITGIKLARQGKTFMTEDPKPAEQDNHYWIGGKWEKHEEEEDSDIHLLKHGYITAVPLNVSQLTHEQHLQSHRDVFDETFGETIK
jgi:5'-nucleotidase